MRLCIVFLYFCKLLYMFRVVTPPIIRSTYNCNHSIWHWSNPLCYYPLRWRGWNCSSSSNLSTTMEGSREGLTSVRCCDYSYMCSWWLVELPPETCRASSFAPRQRKVAETVWPVPDAVITVICAPDDGWSYHPKHVEWAVYRNIINCIYSHLVGQLFTLIHDARGH